ncbi:uncharacterized protein BcabD6B2_51690 [Babesia caballi]|uniref:Uncharacterized protein n=1 Tax=Babesia caballi TaxID=5871 RepID=A0AAV4M115_BABCB|nr:hypothetical protein BcabD6B2_51690 [Babesia caballi]
MRRVAPEPAALRIRSTSQSQRHVVPSVCRGSRVLTLQAHLIAPRAVQAPQSFNRQLHRQGPPHRYEPPLQAHRVRTRIDLHVDRVRISGKANPTPLRTRTEEQGPADSGVQLGSLTFTHAQSEKLQQVTQGAIGRQSSRHGVAGAVGPDGPAKRVVGHARP